MLEENKRLLLAGFEELNSNDNVAKTVNLLESIHCNLMYLSTAADFQANSRYVLRENRELISKEDLEEFQKEYPLQDSLFVSISAKIHIHALFFVFRRLRTALPHLLFTIWVVADHRSTHNQLRVLSWAA